MRSKYILILIFIIFLTSIEIYIENIIFDGNSQNIEALLKNYSESIISEIDKLRFDLETLVKYPSFKKFDREPMKEILTTVIQKNRDFRALYVMDREGHENVNITDFPDIYLDKSSNIWFSDVIKGAKSGYISDVNFIGPAKDSVFSMAVLMRDSSFAVNGLIAGEVDLNYIIDHKINKLDIEELKSYFVITQSGYIIHYSENKDYRSLRLDKKILEHILKENNLMLYEYDLNKFKVYNIPSWKIIFLIERNVFYKEIYYVRGFYFIFILFLLVSLYIIGRKDGKKN